MNHSFRYPRLRAFTCSVLAFALLATHSPASLATTLADQPIFSTSEVPGNLALALSVEWPTASRMAHTDTYSSGATFLGYFDPDKCYVYQANTASNGVSSIDKGDLSYFYPQGKATNHTCTGKWSGNFLNWATTATIDPFRWAMTGGRRVVDTTTETILEKGWHSGQGLFDDRNLPATEITGATPYTASTLRISINGLGFKMRLGMNDGLSRGFSAKYYNNKTVSGNAAATVSNDNAYHDWGSGSPASGVNEDSFSARYDGTFTAPEAGNYTFRTISDDGVRLWVATNVNNSFSTCSGTTGLSGNCVINNWTDHGPTTDTTTTISMTKGQSFKVRLDYYESSGGAQLQLLWKTPSASDFVGFSDGTRSYDFTVRVKVCDSSTAAGGLETNCKAYGSNYKPEGLIQQYSDKMRFSAFGYLNDSTYTRDGGVLRARQKFVGPTYPVPGQGPATNGNREWDSTTGIFTRNPDPTDATATTSNTSVTISDSGVMNYLNKFGQLVPGSYKSNDPVNELFYAALRYYRNLGNVPTWSAMDGADVPTKTTWADGFPVITNWTDPIQYTCQRNFVLGIGDIYTHGDKNVPGNTVTDREPPLPSEVSADTMFDAIRSTNNVKSLQGMGANQATVLTGATSSTDYMAGLALEANMKDIRPDLTGKQTVQTYWVDVLEQSFSRNNKFYMAAKFGGLNQKKIPADFDPYTFSGTIPLDWWSTTGETLKDVRNNSTWDRPDNYFAAGRPDTMVAGLKQAFERISNEISAYTTSFSLSSAQVSSTGVASYAAQYDSKSWTGLLSANQITFDVSGNPTSTLKWDTKTKLEAQLSGTGWDTARRVITRSASAGIPFRYNSLTATQKGSLNTAFVGNDSQKYLNWLRGDRTNERTSSDSSKSYRQRDLLLGDIVNAKVTPAGPPSLNFSDSVNPGYAAFKTTWKDRPVMVYTGANDGMVHAFNGALTGTDAGIEQFAYIPSLLFGGSNSAGNDGLLAKLGNPYYQHRFYVDATPYTFDIDFKSAGGTFTTTSAATSDWRTVLIGGLGKGGKGFYALDVTNPASMNTEAKAAAKVLWEFTDSDMGYSYGAPVVVKTRKYGWVAILTSGYNGGGTSSYLYIVNPTNGQLLQKIATPSESEGMAQAAAYVQDFTDGTADAVYAGDLNGQMWRFDLTLAKGSTANYPAPTLIAKFTDGSDRAQPVTTQPLIEIQPLSKKRFVLVGTGRLLDSSDIQSSQQQSYYAVIDGTASAFSSGTFPIGRNDLQAVTNLTEGIALSATSRGWYTDLGVTSNVGWRVINASTSNSGVVAFSTLQTTGDACSPSGNSRVYAIDFGTGKSTLVDGSGNIVAFNAVGAAVTDLRFLSVDGTTRLVSGDVRGEMKNNPIKLPGVLGLRLLNWREVPTVD